MKSRLNIQMSLNANRVKSSATSSAEARNLKTMRGRNENRSSLLIRLSAATYLWQIVSKNPADEEDCQGISFLAENRDEYSGRTNVPWMFLRRLHISGQAISRGADLNDQSHDVVAAAHKNMSLGCRNISVVETY